MILPNCKGWCSPSLTEWTNLFPLTPNSTTKYPKPTSNLEARFLGRAEVGQQERRSNENERKEEEKEEDEEGEKEEKQTC